MKFDQKILIVRFSSIGDIVQSTSPLKTIRNAFPDFRITFLTLSSYAPLLEMHPDIDSLLFIKRKQSLKMGPLPASSGCTGSVHLDSTIIGERTPDKNRTRRNNRKNEKHKKHLLWHRSWWAYTHAHTIGGSEVLN